MADPTRLVGGTPRQGQVAVGELDDGLVAIGAQCDLDRGRARGKRRVVRDAPGEHDAGRRFDREVLPPHRRARKIEPEAAARLGFEPDCGADPLREQIGLDEIRKDLVRSGGDADRCVTGAEVFMIGWIPSGAWPVRRPA